MLVVHLEALLLNQAATPTRRWQKVSCIYAPLTTFEGRRLMALKIRQFPQRKDPRSVGDFRQLPAIEWSSTRGGME